VEAGVVVEVVEDEVVEDEVLVVVFALQTHWARARP